MYVFDCLFMNIQKDMINVTSKVYNNLFGFFEHSNIGCVDRTIQQTDYR